MTTPLLDRTSAPEVVIIEQPDEPLRCTRGGPLDDNLPEYCQRLAAWESMCMGCGHVLRRCELHYQEMQQFAIARPWMDGAVSHCPCGTLTYVQQFTRIPR